MLFELLLLVLLCNNVYGYYDNYGNTASSPDPGVMVIRTGYNLNEEINKLWCVINRTTLCTYKLATSWAGVNTRTEIH